VFSVCQEHEPEYIGTENTPTYGRSMLRMLRILNWILKWINCSSSLYPPELKMNILLSVVSSSKFDKKKVSANKSYFFPCPMEGEVIFDVMWLILPIINDRILMLCPHQ
jgi:hypothetical protein